MDVTLMHKDRSVAELTLDDATAAVLHIGEVYCPERLPVGVHVRRGIPDRAELNQWWRDRSIPASRSGVRQALEVLEIPDTMVLLTRCFGLSLSDHYWIRPLGREVQWSDVNFFDNAFSEDVGDILLGKNPKKKALDFSSPDNTSDGYLKKRWKIINGKRCLLKSGSSPFMQQPLNEVIASALAERLGIPHVPYRLLWDDGLPYSVCEDFVTKDTELVSAWRVMQTQKKGNSTSVYRHYLNCCEKLGVREVTGAVDRMIVLDYLIANEDRHLNNFGLLRNADTLEWLGAAPVFDSGSSLGYNRIANQITPFGEIECKPFKKTHTEQLKLVTSFDWLDIDAIANFEGEMRKVFDSAGDYMEPARKEAIIRAFSARVERLCEIARKPVNQEDAVAEDVAANQAETYQETLPNSGL